MDANPRHVKDIVMAGLAGAFGEDFVRFLRLDVPPIRAPAPTALKGIIDREMDYLFHLATDEYFHLEFQDRADASTLRRFLLYDALLLERDRRRVHTAVVYTGAVRTAPPHVDGGSLFYRVQNVFLREFDGEATLRALRSEVAGGRRLNRTEALELALLPLMRLGALSMEGAAQQALELLRGVENARERAILAGTVIGLCSRFVTHDAVRRLIDVARTTTPFDDLLAEVEARGIAKGRAEGRADAILHLLRGRFRDPGDALVARIRAEQNSERLVRWLDLAVHCESLAEFERQTREHP